MRIYVRRRREIRWTRMRTLLCPKRAYTVGTLMSARMKAWALLCLSFVKLPQQVACSAGSPAPFLNYRSSLSFHLCLPFKRQQPFVFFPQTGRPSFSRIANVRDPNRFFSWRPVRLLLRLLFPLVDEKPSAFDLSFHEESEKREIYGVAVV